MNVFKRSVTALFSCDYIIYKFLLIKKYAFINLSILNKPISFLGKFYRLNIFLCNLLMLQANANIMHSVSTLFFPFDRNLLNPILFFI